MPPSAIRHFALLQGSISLLIFICNQVFARLIEIGVHPQQTTSTFEDAHSLNQLQMQHIVIINSTLPIKHTLQRKQPRGIFLNNLLTDPQSHCSSSQITWNFLYSALATSSGSDLKPKKKKKCAPLYLTSPQCRAWSVHLYSFAVWWYLHSSQGGRWKR